MLSCEVPGVSIARSIQRRDATGRSWICWVETDVDTSDLVVSTIGLSPATVTVSATDAGCSVTSMIAFWSMTSTIPWRCSLLNPASSTDTEYFPGGSDARRYSPLACDTAVRLNPVSSFFAVTVTPGRTPPLWSLSVPLICAFCAYAGAAHSTTAMTASARNHLRMRLPSLKIAVFLQRR
jgi:hypothetical protein